MLVVVPCSLSLVAACGDDSNPPLGDESDDKSDDGDDDDDDDDDGDDDDGDDDASEELPLPGAGVGVVGGCANAIPD